MKMMRLFSFAALAVALSGFGYCADVAQSTLSDQTSIEVTVYNSNIGLIKDQRKLSLPKGGGELRFMDVAATIMPETVSVTSLNHPDDFRILEQNYEYDLMSSDKILDKYVGKDIKLLNRNYDENSGKTVEDITPATLLSNNNGEQIYQIGGEIFLGHPGDKILPKLPENLIAQPTLTWLYQNAAGKEHDVQVSYLANGINWRADYVILLNKSDDKVGLNGWVTLDNNTGATYDNAKLKLVAGAVNRVQQPNVYPTKAMMGRAMEMDMASPQFEEQSFFEYHIYDLQRPTTIKNNQQKQVSLLESADVSVRKEYIVEGSQNYYWGNYMNAELKDPVRVILRFKNDKDNHLGIPLPQGTMRLYKQDDKGSLQFVGEDRIEHTPRDEWVKLKIGEAFDVTCKRKQKDYKETTRLLSRTVESEWEITLYNHKEEDITVYVDETMIGQDWDMIKSSHPYTKEAAFHVRFEVPVPKDKEVTLSYRVRYDRP